MSDEGSSNSSTSGSGSFSFKRPGGGKKKLRTPFKKNNKAREVSAAIKQQSLEEFQHRQQLFDIEESQSQPNSPTTPRKVVGGGTTEKSEADNAFLRAMRGTNSMDEVDDDDDTSNQEEQPRIISNNPSFDETSSHDGGGGKAGAGASATTTNNNQQAKANNDFLSALQGDSEEPSSNVVSTTRQSKATKTSALSEADHSFLANMHGTTTAPPQQQQQQQTHTINAKTSSFSDADHNFLAQVHGAQTPAQQHQQHSPPTTPPISPPRASFFTSPEGSPTKLPQQQQQHSRLSVTSVHQRDSVTSMSSMESSDVSNQFHSHSPPSRGGGKKSSDLATSNAAFLGALHASVDDDQGGKQQQQQQQSAVIATDGGSFNMDATPNIQRKHLSKNSTASDADAAFLMDVHRSESYASQGSFQGGGGNNNKMEYSSGNSQDSGTFVFKGPSPSSTKADHQSASSTSSSQETGTFVFKGPTPAKDSNAAFMMAIHASGDDADVDSVAGLNDDADNDGDVLVGDDAGDLEDEDIEGLTVPAQPYVEKVMLPRPLFFGNVLPPRITEEAKHAASLYEVGSKGHCPTDSTSDTGDDQDDNSSVSSKGSRLSMSSFGGVGKHDLEPTIAPCCRNLEGAIETFGFGINPFASNDEGEEADESVEPIAPHPYVSLYSPVWEDWARTARVKARRKKAKLIHKTSSRASSATPSQLNQITNRRQSSIKITPKDFGKSQITRETGTSSFESSVTSLTASLDFSHDDVEQAPSIQPQDSLSDDRDLSRDQFLKFARAGFADDGDGNSFDSGGDRKIDKSSGAASVMSQMDGGGTFIQMDSNIFAEAVNNADDTSDDNSVEATEERKSVGLNDNISAAAAMLAGEGADDVDDDAQGGVGTSMFMAVGGGAKAASKYGRPYTNFELTNGCIPQFGSDDPSLPHESDLGAFQTKEEEKRSADERRERNIIEDLAVPGIMPHIACPTQCTDVDDSQCWNARFSGGKLGIKGGPNTMLISLDDNTSTDGDTPSSGKQKQPLVYETSRAGWWNLPTGLSEDSGVKTSKRRKSGSKNTPKTEVFPAFDDPIPLDVQSRLWPPPSLLRENNFSSTRLHPATAAARSLPHLSDRPACMRHIQIDTTAVGFPKLGGEIEPMFCRLAIYHFEMKSTTSPTGKTSFAPNMARCGPVTEALNFDIVQDPSVIQSCKRSLWPYADEAEVNGILGSSSTAGETALEGTTCGVFSLPSNLSLSNLYAVLIVNKVVAGSSDLEHYYKPNRRESKSSSGTIEQIDLQKLRENAAKSSEEFGQYITPFVFGIVPLLHIIETESAKTPVSRAVQIPLFKFAQGRGVESILDHILVMLHPSSEPKIAKAAPLTRGHALLVTRYFGYLGMHSIIDKKSSLSRERLVDFTGELEVKCEDDSAETTTNERCPVLGEPYVLPPWRPHYKIEPAVFGGRTVTPPPAVDDDVQEKKTPRNSFAQELAALPLENSVAEGYGSMSSNAGRYDGLQIHTSLCNELICQPKMLQGCTNDSIVIKVELRKLEWCNALNSEVAVPVTPSIHNTRRGAWLVQEVFTSCAMDATDPRFLDEFKVKLPLILGENSQEKLGLFFSVYSINVRTKRRPSVFLKRDGDDVAHIGSGFLPLARDDSSTCLIENGGYEVPITLRAVELCNITSGQHRKAASFGGNIGKHIRSLSRSSDTLDDNMELDITAHQQAVHDYPSGTLALGQLRSQSYQEQDDTDDNDTAGSKDYASICTPPRRRNSNSEDLQTLSSEKPDSYDESDHKSNPLGSLAKGLRNGSSHGNLQLLMSPKSDCSTEHEMILHVNILAISSVHPQNKTLADLFQMKPKLPRSVVFSDFSDQYYAPWGKQRSEILHRLQPERIPPFHFVGGALAEMERKMLAPVVNLSKGSKCSPTDVMPHLIRVVGQLYRVAVTGTGEPSILWASPDSLIPLRLNAFAALLKVISSVSDHMTNAGLRQLDGNSKWNLLALGKVLSMLFDEGAILGGTLEDLPVDETKAQSPTKPAIISQRSQTVDATSSNARPQLISRYSSHPEDDSPKKFDIDAMLQPNFASKGEDAGSEDLSSLTSQSSGFSVDSKGAFMSALAASLDGDESSNSGAAPIVESSSPRASLLPPRPAASRRRWMTLPTNALATIQESSDDDGRTGSDLLSSSLTKHSKDSLDGELVLNEVKKKPRQMRVPVVEMEKNEDNSMASFLDELSLPATKKEKADDESSLKSDGKHRRIATNDDQIETAGTAFLDAIGKTMGLNNAKGLGGEEKRVGSAHHRKTRSRCSIDWSLPPTDGLLEKDQQIEQLNRARIGVAGPQLVALSPIGPISGGGFSFDGAAQKDEEGKESSSNVDHPLKRLQAKENEGKQKPRAVALPDFADRISGMKDDGKPKRWWPYVYEIIIYQWVALLTEQTKQTKKGDKAAQKPDSSPSSPTGLSPIVVKYLSVAAKASRGATIRCAPYLLEIIKQSLCWRVDSIFRERKNKKPSLDETSFEDAVSPLVALDENTFSALQKLITLLTDASLDSRNFDSFEFRKISIDVNDAVVRFIRDMFSILDPSRVHKLAMVYFARFVTKQGKHWNDRDSKITGLRCSWETTKLRLNAVTLFVRFPEFMKINAPLMESLKAWPAGSSADSTRRFYSHVFEKINRLRLNEFTSGEGPMSKVDIPIPPMKSHWLAEICVDICIFATGHAEQNIQYRASSLLFELFWRHSQQGRANGNISVVASVFLPFLPKILSHVNYLSTLPAKGQLRKDIIPCALFILQSAPVGLVKALWRKLAKRAEGKTQQADSDDRFGGISGSGAGYKELNAAIHLSTAAHVEIDDEPDIYDMLGLLNLALTTVEYEGNMMQIEETDEVENESDENPTWRREFLLSVDSRADNDRGRFSSVSIQRGNEALNTADKQSTQNSRRWYAHDCSMIIINVCRQIVRETLGMLRPSFSSSDEADEVDASYPGVSGSRSMSDIFLQQTSFSHSYDENNSDDENSTNKKESQQQRRIRERQLESLAFSVTDTIIFVRAVTSVYLHTLTMKQSDVAIAKTLTAAVEIVKIFGIKVFLTAVGETLQHWMRVTLEHCGARRADVRVEGSEFLNLLLRLTWEAYGSFFRIRLPLLAVQTEVMERIVAMSATKYIIEQRRLGLDPVLMSNESAEASLTPLWRTIDRLHNQSASRNLSFKSALSRLAVLMKRLFKAYLAAHALEIVSRTQGGSDNVPKTNAYVQRMRVSVHRIVSNAAAFSKMFLGNQATSYLCSVQNEAVEDSFVKAADVYSSTELPSHRVAWLRKLADFHRTRGRFAEEATCRCYIYHTYQEAAKQHEHIWSSSPYLPWASSSDGSHPYGGVAELEPDNASVVSGRLGETSTSFRKIFYRAADSVRVRSGDWGVGGGGKYLFFGVTLKSEFDSVSPWYSHSEMEEHMVAEAELSGDLYLRAGIVESSRYAWSLATNFYSETFNYARLAYVYRRLAIVVTSQVPVIDTSNQLDMSSPIGRFYKVYFHGGAPDDLLHTQGSEGFIYRTPHSVQIKDFAATLENAVRSILPSKTTIDMQIDDGSPTVTQKAGFGKRSNAIGGAPIEPIKIKITPLRPVFKVEDSEKCFRGTPEWFQLKTENYEDARDEDKKHQWKSLPSNHDRSMSLSATHSIGSVGSTATVSNRRSSHQSRYRHARSQQNNGDDFDGLNTELIGVDKFYFTQPTRKDPTRGFRDWLKVPKGKIAERSLRVTELQVSNCFPACTTRQKIIHRAVFTQSPLEASVEAVSTWCSVLFRTITATNGQDVLAGQRQGLNAAAAKLVADCIHRSGVKQIGLTFLSLDVSDDSKNNQQDLYSSYQVLSEEEIEEVQTKLARMIVTFFELLHLLIARNRDVLLTVVQVRKRRARGDSSVASAAGSLHGGYASTPAKGGFMHTPSRRSRQSSSGNGSTTPYFNNPGSAASHHNQNMMSGGNDRTDAAIGVQSELQRGFTNLLKALYPKLWDTINNEVPRWMRHCCQDKYFSSGVYRRAEIPIGYELFFNTDYNNEEAHVHKSSDMSSIVPMSIIRGHPHSRGLSSPGNSVAGSIASERMIHRTNSSESERVNAHSRAPSFASVGGAMNNIHRRSPSVSSVL